MPRWPRGDTHHRRRLACRAWHTPVQSAGASRRSRHRSGRPWCAPPYLPPDAAIDSREPSPQTRLGPRVGELALSPYDLSNMNGVPYPSRRCNAPVVLKPETCTGSLAMRTGRSQVRSNLFLRTFSCYLDTVVGVLASPTGRFPIT